jgi:hypothetical protein
MISPRYHPRPVANGCAGAGLLLLAVLTGHAQSGSGFSGESFGGYSEFRQNPIPIFFPPNPPPLGRAIARTPTPASRMTAPFELKAYVCEPFYPQLSTRLYTRTLNDKLRARLEQYRSAKVALQNELTTEFERLRAGEPEARTAGLAALARKQAAPLAELEKTAESLRQDLYSSEQSWSALREWRLGEKNRRGDSPFEIAQVVRSYAFYQNGLLPAQRRLLREIFLELTTAADTTANATAAQPYLFFPPEPARVLLPDDLSAEAAAKVAAYQTKKSQLKKDLFDAVRTHDGQKMGFLKPNALKSLAEKQAAPLAELEVLAEDIRRTIAQAVEPTAIGERSPLPPTLQDRVAKLIATYAELQRETAAKVEEIIASGRDLPMQASYRFDADGLRYTVIPSRVGRGPVAAPPETLARIEAVRTQIGAVADEYGRMVAGLINEKDAIRTEIAQALGTTKAAAIDQSLMSAMRVATAKETADLYREYRLAVFHPGLSPEQRRLMFDGVVERLDLPLPRGELQPTRRAATW